MNATARRPRSLARSILLVALSGSLLLAAPAAVLAGKPHGGGGGTTSGGATVTAAPNPVVLGAPLTVSGSGYPASTQLQVEFRTSGSDGYIYAASDAYGRFTLTTSIWTSGSVTIGVWQIGRRGGTLVASTSITVQ